MISVVVAVTVIETHHMWTVMTINKNEMKVVNTEIETKVENIPQTECSSVTYLDIVLNSGH